MRIIILDIIIVCTRSNGFSGKKKKEKKGAGGRGDQVFGKRGIDGVKNKNCWSLVIYVARRLKYGDCTGRFYKLGRSYSSPLAEEGKLNGLTSTIFLCCNDFTLAARLFSLSLSLPLLISRVS